MNIFARLSTLIRSNINDLIARAENPEKVLDQVLLDMRDQLTRAKQEVAAAIADERKLRARVEEERQQGQDWERRAMLAVREGRDDLARQALLRQEEHGERAASLRQTWQAQADETEKLKEALRQLSAKMEEARRKRNLLVAKQKRVQAQRRIQETLSGLSDRSAFETFERIADRIEDTERRTLAAAEVDRELTGEPLESEFRRLERGEDSEARLTELKRRMGLVPPAPDASRRLGTGAGEGASDREEGVEGRPEDTPQMSEETLMEEFRELEREDG